jgi:hypothetical protein
MCDLSELEPTTKEIAICIIIVFAVLAGVFFSGYCIGIRNAGKDVSNNGDGINHVGEQLGQAVSNQQQITDGIKDAEHTSSGIAETGAAIAESAKHIEAGVGEAAGLIDSSQQILGRIRNRGQANPPAN